MHNRLFILPTDPIGIPKIQVKNTDGDFWTLRCVAKAGKLCNFYINNSEELIKETQFQGSVCVERVSKEVLWKERMMSSGVVSFSCEVKLEVRDEGSGSSSWAVRRSKPYNFTEKGEASKQRCIYWCKIWISSQSMLIHRSVCSFEFTSNHHLSQSHPIQYRRFRWPRSEEHTSELQSR